ncbi:MAG: hypothetical protein IJT09_00830, partial [Abditibacteriota bacterium]|nr:hypothetical protein [Abditibacteriota bacterium]
MKRILIAILLFASSICSAQPLWIDSEPSFQPLTYHKVFELPFKPEKAYVKYACAAERGRLTLSFTAFVNGAATQKGFSALEVQYIDVSGLLNLGKNSVAIEITPAAACDGLPVFCEIAAVGTDDKGREKHTRIYSDESWVYTRSKYKGIDSDISEGNEVKPADIQLPIPTPAPQPVTNRVIPAPAFDIVTGYAEAALDFATPDDMGDLYPLMKKMGVSALEMRIFDNTNRLQSGERFWGTVTSMAEKAFADNVNLTYCPITHIIPDYDGSALRLRAEADIDVYSLWTGRLGEIAETYYGELARVLKTQPARIHPGICGTTGEVGFPAPGGVYRYFAADPAAWYDFTETMTKKYGSEEEVLKAWHASEIAYPKTTSHPQAVLDFCEWYSNSMTKTAKEICSSAKKHFDKVSPKIADISSPARGVKPSALVKALSDIGCGVDCVSENYAEARLLSTACAYYKVPFESALTDNVFDSALCGSKSVFADPEKLVGLAHILTNDGSETGTAPATTTTALLFPETAHILKLTETYPKGLTEFVNELRDICDFDIIDETLIADGALKKYKTLIIFDTEYVKKETAEAIKASGVKALVKGESVKTIDGADADFPTEEYAPEKITSPLSAAADGVLSAVTEDRVIYRNTTDNPVTIKENIPEDFLKAAKLPYDKDRLTYEITLPAKSVKSHIFARKPFEAVIEIENTAPPEAKRERVYRSSYGKTGVSVRLTEETKISAEITVPENGKYSFCVMGRSLGGSAKLKIDGKEAATVCAETSADLRYPICAK